MRIKVPEYSERTRRHNNPEFSFARRSMCCKIFFHFSGSRPIKHAAIPQRTRLIRSQKRKSPGGPEIGRLITAEFRVSVQSELSDAGSRLKINRL